LRRRQKGGHKKRGRHIDLSTHFTACQTSTVVLRSLNSHEVNIDPVADAVTGTAKTGTTALRPRHSAEDERQHARREVLRPMACVPRCTLCVQLITLGDPKESMRKSQRKFCSWMLLLPPRCRKPRRTAKNAKLCAGHPYYPPASRNVGRAALVNVYILCMVHHHTIDQ